MTDATHDSSNFNNEDNLPSPLQFALISKNKPLCELVKFVFESQIKVDIYLGDNLRNCLEHCKVSKERPHLIIYDYDPNDYGMEDFAHYLVENAPKAYLVTMTNMDVSKISRPSSELENFIVIEKVDLLRKILELAKELFPDLYSYNTAQHARISLECLNIIDGVNNDLYIKLKSGKIIKLFKEGDDIEASDLSKYKEKGLDYLFVKQTSITWIVHQIMKQFPLFFKTKKFKFILRSPSESIEKKFEQKIIKIQDELHMDEDFKNKIVNLHTKAMNVVKKNPDLAKIIKKLMNDYEGMSYFSRRSHLLTMISTSIAQKLEWCSQMVLEKLAYASILHDITMAPNEKLLSIDSIEYFNQVKKDLTKEEQQKYLDHPLDCARLAANSFDGIPPETDTLIIQHHELPKGNGFPNKISWNRISPISALFIIAHDFTHYIIKNETFSVDSFLKEAEVKYNVSIFKNILKILKEFKLEENIKEK